jgi:hypothetical protein
MGQNFDDYPSFQQTPGVLIVFQKCGHAKVPITRPQDAQ